MGVGLLLIIAVYTVRVHFTSILPLARLQGAAMTSGHFPSARGDEGPQGRGRSDSIFASARRAETEQEGKGMGKTEGGGGGGQAPSPLSTNGRRNFAKVSPLDEEEDDHPAPPSPSQ